MVPPAQQSHSEAQDDPGGRSDINSLLVTRRPSTNTVFHDRWLHFTHLAARQGIVLPGPTAAKIAAFLYYLFDTNACHLSLSKDTGPA